MTVDPSKPIRNKILIKCLAEEDEVKHEIYNEEDFDYFQYYGYLKEQEEKLFK